MGAMPSAAPSSSTTKDPADEIEGQVRLGYGNGNSMRAQGAISGPDRRSETLKFRASLSYLDTDGFLENEYLGEKADPARDISGRARLIWEPNEDFTADLRFYGSQLDTARCTS